MANTRKYCVIELCEKYNVRLIKEVGKHLYVEDVNGFNHKLLRDMMGRGTTGLGMKSALNKTDYFLFKLRDKFQDIDNYCDFSKFNYIKSLEYVTITCKKHGDIKTKPNWLMNTGMNCIECCNEEKKKPLLTTDQYVANVKKKHGDRYDYSRTIFKGSREIVTVDCRDHGSFDIIAYYHHNGNGCPKCGLISGGYGKSDYVKVCGNRSSNVYLFKISNDLELFYKIGISINPKARASDIVSSSGYSYDIEILHSQEYSYSGDAWDVEKILHGEFTEDSYKPLIKFDGDTECFKLNPSDVVKILELLG